MTDKHKVLQILVNLIRNAKDALRRMPEPTRQAAISGVARSEDRGAHRA